MNWTYIRYGFFMGILGYYAACAPVKFSKEPPQSNCGSYGLSAEQCVTASENTDKITDSFTVNGGLVDILFISDNSGSMGRQQIEMANRFSSFTESIKNLDYRIAITTQDISSSPNNEARAINGNGALQDGKLIPFPNGGPFLTKATPNVDNEFAQTIKRNETIQCENWLSGSDATSLRNSGRINSSDYQVPFKANCTSGDDRPIYATNLVVQENPSGFIRPTAHLAVVLLTDEDNRSFGCDVNTGAGQEQCASGRSQYTLQSADLNETLINNVSTRFPQKTFSVHAIIVRPGDMGCLDAQNQELSGVLKSREGHTYAQLVSQTSGVLGDICSNNYTHELGQIGSNIVDRIQDRNLFCANPGDLDINFEPATKAVSWVIENKTVKFANPLDPGVKVTLSYTCPKFQKQ
ncbi:MAG: hypothetical protein AB7O96_10475 [Pseudobdellovibrionaceae bacterium]